MKRAISVLCVAFAASTTLSGGEPEQHVKTVADTEGLIAFWDFSLMEEGKQKISFRIVFWMCVALHIAVVGGIVYLWVRWT
jgi:hypothetical protein